MLRVTSLDIVLVVVFAVLLWRERRNPDVWRIGLAVVALLAVVHWRLASSRDWLVAFSSYVTDHLRDLS